MLKLTYYVPKDYSELVKNALFAIGAGKIGHYDSCCFETEGVGQFRPLEGSNPKFGNLLEIKKINESRVEMVLDDIIVKDVIAELKRVHPYEMPAYDIVLCLEY
jgi:hypothetical protein